jgi:hypothetical protein
VILHPASATALRSPQALVVLEAMMQRVRRVRPEVESLESRDVAAIFTASSQASLAAAIRTSNSNGQADTIRVVRNIDLAATPLPAFSRDAGHAVTLDGAGHKVRRVGAAPFRILENAGARLTVENIHLAGGVAMEQGAAASSTAPASSPSTASR